MSAPQHSETFPRGALIAAAALLVFSLAAAGTARLLDVTAAEVDAVTRVAAQRELTFTDLADGSVQVRDVDRGRVVATLEPGTSGFLRGLMRAMVRERRLHGVGPQTPFRLAYGEDGALVLEDPATDSRIALKAFGPTNAAAFVALLDGTSGT